MAVKLDRATVCLATTDRCASHIFYADFADDAPKRDCVRTGCLPAAMPDGL
jgi:hypothetical protein